MHDDQRCLTSKTGPAHAVYFATYEAVKAGMGGNEDDGHHPLAAGTLLRQLTTTESKSD